MTRSLCAMAAAMLVAPALALAQAVAQTGAPAPQPSFWFAPPSIGRTGVPTVDMASGAASQENVEVLAKRPTKTWRSTLARVPDSKPTAAPLGLPAHNFEYQKPYCNSALRTVGGQPASAADMMVGGSNGGC